MPTQPMMPDMLTASAVTTEHDAMMMPRSRCTSMPNDRASASPRLSTFAFQRNRNSTPMNARYNGSTEKMAS